MGVAEAAIAAGQQHTFWPTCGHVGDQRLVVVLEHLRADGHAQHHVGRVGAVAVLAHAVGAGLGLEMLLVAVVDQRIEPVDALDHDVAAAPAIAAVRAAEFDEFFAQERHRAGAAIAGADVNLGLIEELHESAVMPFHLAAAAVRVSIWRTCSPRARQCRVADAGFDEAELLLHGERGLVEVKHARVDQRCRLWPRNTSRPRPPPPRS